MDAGPQLRPGLVAIGQPSEYPMRERDPGVPCGTRRRAGWCPARSIPALHPIEEGIAVVQSDAGPEPPTFRPPAEAVTGLAVPSLQIGTERPLHHGAKGCSVAGRPLLCAAQDFVIEVQCRSHHTKAYHSRHKCVDHIPVDGVRERGGNLAGLPGAGIREET